MQILQEIRKQTPGLRFFMFALCVVTTISMVGVLWFQSFQRDLYALLNPEEETQERYFANQEGSSPLGLLKSGWQGFRANISGALGLGSEDIRAQGAATIESQDGTGSHLFPIAEDEQEY